MKMYFYLWIVLFLVGSCQSQSSAKEQQWYKEAQKAQHELNLQYADKEKSPLTEEDFTKFRSLDFFPISKKYVIEARFVKNEHPIPFEMSTTTDRKPIYQKYGSLFFELDDVSCELPVYQNLDLMNNPEYQNYIFVPFTDLTTGDESYGGGRYVDLELPFKDRVVIDFNRAYNPYCAYNHRYSCAVPPEENNLAVEIKAGVKAFH
jgi:uncharacterized protein (DUF1684 family)